MMWSWPLTILFLSIWVANLIGVQAGRSVERKERAKQERRREASS